MGQSFRKDRKKDDCWEIYRPRTPWSSDRSAGTLFRMSRVDVIGPTPHWDRQQYYPARLLQHYKTHQQRTCNGESGAYWHLRPIAGSGGSGPSYPRARDRILPRPRPDGTTPPACRVHGGKGPGPFVVGAHRFQEPLRRSGAKRCGGGRLIGRKTYEKVLDEYQPAMHANRPSTQGEWAGIIRSRVDPYCISRWGNGGNRCQLGVVHSHRRRGPRGAWCSSGSRSLFCRWACSM